MNLFYDDDAGKLIVRLMVSVLILFHGVGKILHPAGTLGFVQSLLAQHGLPEFIAYGVFLGEVVGPLMILLGLFSRVGGVMVVINMLFAIGLVHMGDIFALTDMGTWALESDVFFLLSGLAVVFLGSGRFAIRED